MVLGLKQNVNLCKVKHQKSVNFFLGRDTFFLNGPISRIEPGMNEIKFENHLVEGYPAGGGNLLKKPWWVNWIER